MLIPHLYGHVPDEHQSDEECHHQQPLCGVEAGVAQHPQGQQVVQGPLPVVEGQGVQTAGQPVQQDCLDTVHWKVGG